MKTKPETLAPRLFHLGRSGGNQDFRPKKLVWNSIHQACPKTGFHLNSPVLREGFLFRFLQPLSHD